MQKIDYNEVCKIVGDLYLKYQRHVDVQTQDYAGAMEEVRKQLKQKEDKIEQLEQEILDLTNGSKRGTRKQNN